LSQFTSSGHYKHAVFTLDRLPSALEVNGNDNVLYKFTFDVI